MKKTKRSKLFVFLNNMILHFVLLSNSVALYFGIVTCGAGILGVVFGSEIARRYIYLKR